MTAVLDPTSSQSSLDQADDFHIHLPEVAQKHDETKETTQHLINQNDRQKHRKLRQKEKDGDGVPNLLKLSKIRKAVMKLSVPGEDGSREIPRYTGTGHRCWSSLRTREWQEFQRSMKEEADPEDGQYEAPASFVYFNTPSRSLSTRGSKRPARKQVASPDSGFYEKARLADFERIENVYSTIKQNRTQKWRDILEGVPSQYDSKIKPIKVKFIFENENILQKQRKARRLKWQEEVNSEIELRGLSPERSVSRRRFSSQDFSIETASNQDRAHSGQRGASRLLCKSAGASIPGPFVFPRPSDFVPENGTKVNNMGVDWKYAKCHKDEVNTLQQRAISAPSVLARTGPKKCLSAQKMHKASFNPVTEALRREGMCVAKLKGKVMAPSDLQVAKVWKRKITNIIIPADMAKKDIPESAIRGVKNRGKTDGQCDRLVEDDEDFSDDRQSISREESSNEEGGSLVTNS